MPDEHQQPIRELVDQWLRRARADHNSEMISGLVLNPGANRPPIEPDRRQRSN